MKLLGSDTSPYTRKARLVLLEKGLPHQYLVTPPREPGSPTAALTRVDLPELGRPTSATNPL